MISVPVGLTAVRAALDNDAVQVVVNGTSYQGWLDIDIDSDILNPADAFRVSGAMPKPKPSSGEVRAGAPEKPFDDFREGNAVDVYVGLDRQMAGVIDDVQMSGDRSSSRLTLTGRDKGAFLVDCEAKHIKAAKYTVQTLIETLLDPSWGIKNVLLTNEDNRKLLLGKKDKTKPSAIVPKFLKQIARDRTKVDPGQKVASIIDTHCKRLGITWWITAQGDLFIGKPNYQQDTAYHFKVYALGSASAKENNVESWQVERAIADRYSEVKVVGQGWGDPKKLWTGTTNKPTYTATAQDPDLVERGIVRKLIIADSDILSQDEAQARADHEMGVRRLKAETITLTVPGFREGDRLYAVDTIASVKIEEAAIDDNYYVTQRRFTESRGKRRTQLTLHPKKVWLS